MRTLVFVLLLVAGCASQAALNPMIDGIHGYPWAWMSHSDWSKVWLPGDTVQDLNEDPKGIHDGAGAAIGKLPPDFTGTLYYDFAKGRAERIRIERGEVKEVWFERAVP